VFVCQQCAATFAEDGYCAHDGSKLQPNASDPLVGSKVGPYEIDSLIGVGGMGRVYKAVHPKIGSRVAVKVLSHGCSVNPELIARFFDEARAVNVIRHESIVNILDLDHLPDGRPYIVMEFLDGLPLSSLLQKGRPLPIGTLLRIFEDVLSALGAAHQQKIVHRDLKPDNIFISPNGRPKVLDFGVAKLATEESSLNGQTQEGSLLGTPHYMSPEQALSRPVDARADLYSVGVILYECVTGQKPFQSESLFTLLQQHVSEVPREPRAIRPNLSAGLEAIILRAMHKDPNQRFQSASELSQALIQEQHGLPNEEWAPVGISGAANGQSNSPSKPPSVQSEEDLGRVRSPVLSAPPPVAVPSKRSGPLIAAMLFGGLLFGAGVVWQSQSEPAASPAAEGEEPVVAESQETDAAPTAEVIATHDAAVELAELVPPDAAVVAAAPTEKVDPPPRKPEKQKRDRQRRTPEVDKPAANDSKPVPKRDSIATPSPGRFDVSGYIGTAQRRARQAFGDAKLVRIDADGVLPNGKANLSLSPSFSVLYRFKSPSQGKRPKDLPLGMDHKPTCIFYVSVGAKETDNYPLEGWDCSKMAVAGRPRCTSKQIWQKAIADGAPKSNAVAELGYRKSSGSNKWYFSIKQVFSKTYDDDC
jgi:serine/threonine-protein kinase